MTASSQVRAERRALDMAALGQPCDVDQIREEIEARDYRDMHRANSPLVQVDDAIVIDTSYSTLEETLEEVMGYIRDYLDGKGK